MDKEGIFCSSCGVQNPLYGTEFEVIALNCSHCGRAVKHWSCRRESCRVVIWSKVRRRYVCTECTLSECKVASGSSSTDISMLSLSLSLELYYKSRKRMISEEGYTLNELWRKAQISDTNFARQAAKDAAAAAYRASEMAEFTSSASARTETAARTMLSQLARSQARARARASVSPESLSKSGLNLRVSNRVKTPSFKQNPNIFRLESERQGHQMGKESAAGKYDASMHYPQTTCYHQLRVQSHRRIRRRGMDGRKLCGPLLCRCCDYEHA